MARSGMKTYPRHIKVDGRGARHDDASGFVRKADDYVHDVRQGKAATDFADTTPGFGTLHPQDAKRIPPKVDPKNIREPRPDNNPMFLSAADMGYTDAEVRESIRTGVPLRPKK